MSQGLRAIAALALAGCGGDSRTVDTAAAVVSTVPAAPAADSGPPGKPACPATGQWVRCAIVERLERSGLAPRVDSTAIAEEPPLAAKGFVVHLNRGELEIYLYPDAEARARDQARLDSAKYAAYAAPLAMARQPTLIASGNLLAVLESVNDHLRERVGDAITAGAPARAP